MIILRWPSTCSAPWITTPCCNWRPASFAPARAAELADCANRAWAWAESRRDAFAERLGPAYQDNRRHARATAAVELLRLTRDRRYDTAYLEDSVLRRPNPVPLVEQQGAAFAYARLPAGLGDGALKQEARAALIATAEAALAHADRHPFGITTELPLLLDLTNPTPAIGWDNTERPAFFQRVRADVVMALALVHHLAISNNVPLEDIARALAQWGTHLIIEFVPKSDSQVQRLLAAREDIFPDYTLEGFTRAFSRHFRLEQQIDIPGTQRTLFLFASN